MLKGCNAMDERRYQIEARELDLKRAKHRVQILSSVALMLSVLAVAVAVAGIFGLIWAAVTFVGWLF